LSMYFVQLRIAPKTPKPQNPNHLDGKLILIILTQLYVGLF